MSTAVEPITRGQRYLTPADIAERTGIERKMVYRMLEAGQIPALRPPGGRRWIISPEAFRRWWETAGQQPREAIQ